MRTANFNQKYALVFLGLLSIWVSGDLAAQEEPVLRIEKYFDSAAISPDGKYLLTYSSETDSANQDSSAIRVLDSQTGEQVQWYSLALNDSAHIESGKNLSIDPAPPSLQPFMARSTGWMAISPNGKYVLASCGVYQARLWDAKTGTIVNNVFSPRRNAEVPNIWKSLKISDVGFSPDSQKFFTLDETGILQIWDTATQHELFSYDLSDLHISHQYLYFLSDNRTLFCNDGNKSALFDSETGKLIRRFEGWSGTLSCDEKIFLFYYKDDARDIQRTQSDGYEEKIPVRKGKFLEFHNAQSGEQIREGIPLNNYKYISDRIELSPFGNLVFLVGGNRSITRISENSTKETSNSPTRLLSYEPFRVFQEFPLDLEETPKYVGGGGWYNYRHIMKFFPDGKRILLVDRTSLQVWDVNKYLY